MYCEKCNTKVAQSIRICPKCGNRSFSESITTQTQIPPRTNKVTQRASVSQAAISTPRPWIRLWARTIDYLLFAIVLGFLHGYLFPNLPFNDRLFGFFLPILWLLGEPFCISNFGTTPGKKMLKITLKHNSGNKINFANALTRSAQVLWRGLALGLPIVYIITGCVAYSNLTKNGTTTWDKDGGFVVTHDRIGLERVLLIIVLIGLPVGFLIWLGAQTPQNTYL
jgi:uncharacterized RDD family membrane protein YckC